MGVVDVGARKKIGRTGVPEVARLFGPCDGGFVESGVGVVGYGDEAFDFVLV